MLDLDLGSTAIYFIPSLTSEDEHEIVQVTLEAASGSISSETINKWLHVRPEVQSFISLLLRTPHALPSPITFAGEGYDLTLERRPWGYGKTWVFEWGGREVRSGDKWVFWWADVKG